MMKQKTLKQKRAAFLLIPFLLLGYLLIFSPGGNVGAFGIPDSVTPPNSKGEDGNGKKKKKPAKPEKTTKKPSKSKSGGGGLGCQQEAGKKDCVQKKPGGKPFAKKSDEGYQCGNLPDDADNVHTKINFGCLGPNGPVGLGPIQDMVFAIVRFLSVGVGIAVTVSLIIAGIQYSTAEGNPESSQKAKLRVQQALIGLAIYIFLWSLLQFLIPGGLFNA